jgi:tyrosyl-tRNA synthetase
MNKEKTIFSFDREMEEFFDPEGIFANKIKAKKEGKYNKDIVIKFGVDPTRPDIHLGHAVVFRFLRKMQDLGCKVVFLVGDFTARIGDPTGKSKVRPEIEQAEIESNMKTYLEQVGKILRTDKNVFSWIRNSDWFYGVEDIVPGIGDKVTMNVKKAGIAFDAEIPSNSFIGKAALFENTRMQSSVLSRKQIVSITVRGLLWTLRHVTHQRLISRDMFQDRLKKGEELYMHEMLYPVLQGIDSFVLAQIYGSCDLEIGGTDQTFNMLIGRDIMKINETEPQSVISCKILKGLDGKEKMSKSLDNYIAINEEPTEIFGKVMSIPDELIEEYYRLCTNLSEQEIESKIQQIKNGKNPKDVKLNLAKEIIKVYYSDKEAESSALSFENVFSKGEFPEDAKIIEAGKDEKICDVLVSNNIVPSKSEYRRLAEGGAVTDFLSNKIEDVGELVGEKERKLRIGKKIFIVIRSI